MAPLIEPFDSFLTDLRTKAEACDFADLKGQMIRDKIIFTVSGKLQELLLRESEKLNLMKAVEICRAFEVSQKQAKEVSTGSRSSCIATGGAQSAQSINKVYPQANSDKKKKLVTKKTQCPKKPTAGGKTGPSEYIRNCRYCGQGHMRGAKKCPAWKQTCAGCGGRNHLKAVCKKIQQVEIEDEEDDLWLMSINSVSNHDQATIIMRVNSLEVRFQIDSAADVNTICQKYVKTDQVKATNQKLTMWNGSKFSPLGEAELAVVNPKNPTVTKNVRFTVVLNNHNCLLGLKTSKEMELLPINTDSFISCLCTTYLDI